MPVKSLDLARLSARRRFDDRDSSDRLGLVLSPMALKGAAFARGKGFGLGKPLSVRLLPKALWAEMVRTGFGFGGVSGLKPAFFLNCLNRESLLRLLVDVSCNRFELSGSALTAVPVSRFEFRPSLRLEKPLVRLSPILERLSENEPRPLIKLSPMEETVLDRPLKKSPRKNSGRPVAGLMEAVEGGLSRLINRDRKEDIVVAAILYQS